MFLKGKLIAEFLIDTVFRVRFHIGQISCDIQELLTLDKTSGLGVVDLPEKAEASADLPLFAKAWIGADLFLVDHEKGVLIVLQHIGKVYHFAEIVAVITARLKGLCA